MARSGFTLLEVLIAFLVMTTGVLAMLECQRRFIRLGAIGRERGRAALALESRADWLRAEARKNGCMPPVAGSASRPDGIQESWTASATGGTIEARAVAWITGRSIAPDTVLVRFPCG